MERWGEEVRAAAGRMHGSDGLRVGTQSVPHRLNLSFLFSCMHANATLLLPSMSALANVRWPHAVPQLGAACPGEHGLRATTIPYNTCTCIFFGLDTLPCSSANAHMRPCEQ